MKTPHREWAPLLLVILSLTAISLLVLVYYSKPAGGELEIILPGNYSLENKPALYILRVEQLSLNTAHAAKILDRLLEAGSRNAALTLSKNAITFFEKGRRGVVDYSLEKNGRLRYYRVIYNYTNFSEKVDKARAAVEAKKILEFILRVYSEAGFSADEWRFSPTSVSSDIVLLGNTTSKTVVKKHGRISAIFTAYYRGLKVYGLYRVEFFSDGTIAGVLLDLWNTRPVKKLKESQVIGVKEALKKHVDPRLLAELAENNTIRLSRVELAYVPITLPNGTTYLLPMYIVEIKEKHARIKIPAIEDRDLYQILKEAYSTLTATTTKPKPLICPKPIISIIASIEIKRGEKITIIDPRYKPSDAEKILKSIISVLEERLASPLMCWVTEERLRKEMAETSEYIHIVFEKPGALKLTKISGPECEKILELYLTPLPDSYKKYTLCVKSVQGYWGCFVLQEYPLIRGESKEEKVWCSMRG